jgi:hypothetical protein
MDQNSIEEPVQCKNWSVLLEGALLLSYKEVGGSAWLVVGHKATVGRTPLCVVFQISLFSSRIIVLITYCVL